MSKIVNLGRYRPADDELLAEVSIIGKLLKKDKELYERSGEDKDRRRLERTVEMRADLLRKNWQIAELAAKARAGFPDDKDKTVRIEIIEPPPLDDAAGPETG